MPDTDEPIDAPLEESIRRHARGGDRPVDPRTVAQRAMATPVRSSGPRWRIAGGLVTLAAAAVIVIAILALGPFRQPPNPVPIGATPTPAPTATTAAVASPTASPTPAPTPAPTPTPTPSPTPSVEATPTPSAPTSPSPTESVAPTTPASPPQSTEASPSVSTAPSASLPAATGPVPSGFQPQSAAGTVPLLNNQPVPVAGPIYVLGSVPCGSSTCPAIARSLDDTRSWSLMDAAPKTTIVQPGSAIDYTTGVSAVTFIDAFHGWAYGPDLWTTTDGGLNWSKESLPAGIHGPVVAFDVANGSLRAVIFDLASTSFRIMSGGYAPDSWTMNSFALPVGAGPVPQIQLEGRLLLQNDRTVVNGGRMTPGGDWQPWTPVCADAAGPAFLANEVSLNTGALAVCDVGAWATPKGTQLFETLDQGTTWKQIGTNIPLTSTQMAATFDTFNIVVAGSDGTSTVLLHSGDQGATWDRQLNLGNRTVTQLSLADGGPSDLIAVAPAGDSNVMYHTENGGESWTKVTF
jgi:hypothetical protein